MQKMKTVKTLCGDVDLFVCNTGNYYDNRIAAGEWLDLDDNEYTGKIYADTWKYIAIIYAGLPATILYNMLAAIARSLGDSKTPLVFLVLSSILNIGLDFLLVAVIPLGVSGAAYATVAAQAVSGVLCLVYVWKNMRLYISERGESDFIAEYSETFGDGSSDGTAVFYYSDWNDDCTVFVESARLYVHCILFCNK